MASGKEINTHTFPGWAIKGLGGVVNILEAMDLESMQLTDEQSAEFQDLVYRVLRVSDRLLGINQPKS